MEQFLSIAMESLEKNWFDFNTSTQNALVQIAGHVMNSKAGIKLSGAYPSYCSYCCSCSLLISLCLSRQVHQFAHFLSQAEKVKFPELVRQHSRHRLAGHTPVL